MAKTKFKYLVFPIDLAKKSFVARRETFDDMIAYGVGHEAYQITKKRSLSFGQHLIGSLLQYRKGTRMPTLLLDYMERLDFDEIEIAWVDGIPDYEMTSDGFSEEHFNIIEEMRENALTELMEFNSINVAAGNLGIRVGDPSGILKEYKNAYRQYNGTPTPSMNKDVLFNFRDSNKSEFELICFCVCAGLKSMLGTKSFMKTNIKAVMERSIILGNENVDIAAKYSSRRLWDKLITYLEDHWGLKYYSNYTRGFYVSFKMSREELAYKAETMKATAKVEKMKKRQADAKKLALEKIKSELGL